MPLPPANPPGSPLKRVYDVPWAAVAAGNDDTTQELIVEHTGYVTAIRLIPDGSFVGAATNNRTWTFVDPTTRATSGDGNTTNNSALISSATAAFTQDDVGKAISGTNIPGSTTILSVQSATQATLSANATGTATTTVFTIGSSRTIGTLTGATSATTFAAGVEFDIPLSGTDTRVFKGDALQLVSTHIGTGLADPGGTVQIEVTSFGEGSG